MRWLYYNVKDCSDDSAKYIVTLFRRSRTKLLLATFCCAVFKKQKRTFEIRIKRICAESMYAFSKTRTMMNAECSRYYKYDCCVVE